MSVCALVYMVNCGMDKRFSSCVGPTCTVLREMGIGTVDTVDR